MTVLKTSTWASRNQILQNGESSSVLSSEQEAERYDHG
jgi:hypothetical protein